MTTRKQIEANRRNARSSTGPQTRTGKAASKLNALKHGLRAEEFVVLDEDPADFASVLEILVDESQPQGPLEERLIERVAACMWRLRRLYRVEAGIFNTEILTIELDRARNEAKSYEQSESDIILASLSKVQITDENRHNRATVRVEKTARLLQDESLAIGVAFKQDVENAGAISKLSRYEAAIERSLYRALHELQRIQAARENGQQPPSIAVDVTVDGPGAASDSED